MCSCRLHTSSKHDAVDASARFADQFQGEVVRGYSVMFALGGVTCKWGWGRVLLLKRGGIKRVSLFGRHDREHGVTTPDGRSKRPANRSRLMTLNQMPIVTPLASLNSTLFQYEGNLWASFSCLFDMTPLEETRQNKSVLGTIRIPDKYLRQCSTNDMCRCSVPHALIEIRLNCDMGFSGISRTEKRGRGQKQAFCGHGDNTRKKSSN